MSHAVSEAGSSYQAGPNNSTTRTAHNIAIRFRSNQFSGNIGESWNEYVAEYLQVARDYNLSTEKKLEYLHNVMSGDAKRFYLRAVEPHATTFQQAIELIGKEYNYIVRQNRVKNVLNQLRLNDKLGESTDKGEALAKVYKIITKLSP